MIKSISPLRYPGGKKLLTKFLADVIKHNSIRDTVYVEPFAGGAGAALNLLLMEYVDEIIINDADYNIFCFWEAVLNNTDNFIQKIKKIKIDINNWNKQKLILNEPKENDPFEVGFATFFLNRCNRSGILNAGPIGGIEQMGAWAIDARFNKKELISRIEKVSFYCDRIKIYNLDAIEFLKLLKDKQNIFIYIDPPYYVEGKKLYLNYYEHDDHANLASFILNELSAPWVLSYDNVHDIFNLSNSRTNFSYDLRYSANRSKVGKEIMFFSDKLKIPKELFTHLSMN